MSAHVRDVSGIDAAGRYVAECDECHCWFGPLWPTRSAAERDAIGHNAGAHGLLPPFPDGAYPPLSVVLEPLAGPVAVTSPEREPSWRTLYNRNASGEYTRDYDAERLLDSLKAGRYRKKPIEADR